MSPGAKHRVRHVDLALYFESLPLLLQSSGDITYNRRKCHQQPYQQLHAERWEALETTLTDLDFVDAKAKAGMVFDLLRDYAESEQAWPGHEGPRPKEGDWKRRMREYGEALIAHSRAHTALRCGAVVEIPPLPEPPAAVARATEIEGDGTPHEWTSLDRVRSWKRFVAHHTQRLAAGKEPVSQLAFNSAASGPVVEAVDGRMRREQSWLELRFRPAFVLDPLCLQILEGHKEGVRSVAVTPDGRCAVSGSEDGTVRVWNLDTAECRVLKGHQRAVRAVVVTPDGRCVVSGDYGGWMRVWDLETGQSREFEGHMGAVAAVVVTPGGEYAVSGSEDATVRVWDLDTGQCRVLEGHTDDVCAMAVTPDGRRAISGSLDHTLRVWDIETGQSRVIRGHTSPVWAVAVTPDGRHVVSGSGWVSENDDNTVRLWDLETGGCPSRAFEGHTTAVDGVALTPGGRCAVSGGSSRLLRVWDLETGLVCLFERHKSGVSAVAVTPDGGRVLSQGYVETIVWDLETGRYRVLEERPGGVREVSAIAITPDGRRAISGGRGGLRVIDLETGRSRLLEEQRGTSCVSVTPDGRQIVSGGRGDTLGVWDIEACHSRILDERKGFLRTVAVTPDGRRAVCARSIFGQWYGDVRVWDLETGDSRGLATDGKGDVVAVAVSPDGRRACGSQHEEKTVRVWDLDTGRCRVLEGHTSDVNAVLVTADGQCVVSGSDDNTVRVWDLETGECIAIYRSSSHVKAVAQWRATLAVGTGAQGVEFLWLAGARHALPNGASIVTPVRLWLCAPGISGGHWDSALTADCDACGRRFPTPAPILDAIAGIIRNAGLSQDDRPFPVGAESASTRLPAEAWIEPRLLSECPVCHEPLRFNPFVVDPRNHDAMRPAVSQLGSATAGDPLNEKSSGGRASDAWASLFPQCGTATLCSGGLVAARYRVVGAGKTDGGATVYEAQDETRGEPVALEILPHGLLADSQTFQSFQQEMPAARRLGHPNVCRILDMGACWILDPEHPPDDIPHVFLTTELLRGETLAARLQRVERLTMAEALPIARQVADGLQAIHARKIVHGDLNSEHVMIIAPRGEERGEERVVVTRLSISLANRFMALEGVCVGTPAYMAPEQIRDGKQTQSTDIYALGVLIYRMVTGKMLQESENLLSLMWRRVNEPAPSPRELAPDLDRQWEQTILRCLEREPGRRFRRAKDVAAALRHG